MTPKFVLLIIFVLSVYSQRGGGSSSHSSSSSSSSSRSSSSSSSSTVHVKSCYENCPTSDPNAQASCKHQCDQQAKLAGIIIGGLIGGGLVIFGIVMLFLVLIRCCKESCQNKGWCCYQTSINQQNDRQIQYKAENNPNRHFEQEINMENNGKIHIQNLSQKGEDAKQINELNTDFVKQVNNIQSNQNLSTNLIRLKPIYTAREFEKQIQIFVESEWNFFYIQKGKKYDIRNYKFRLTKITDFQYTIFGTGRDDAGSWEYHGKYFDSETGIKVKWNKEYHNKNAAGQTGLWHTLIYEGQMNDIKNYVGKWYYVGFQRNYQYSGEWKMIRIQ